MERACGTPPVDHGSFDSRLLGRSADTDRVNLEFVPFPTSSPAPEPPTTSSSSSSSNAFDLERDLFPDLAPLDLSEPTVIPSAPIFGGRAVISGLALAALLGSGIGFITMRATAPSEAQVRLIAGGDNAVSLGSGGTDPATGAPAESSGGTPTEPGAPAADPSVAESPARAATSHRSRPRVPSISSALRALAADMTPPAVGFPPPACRSWDERRAMTR